jgi:phosphoadenosine phosphosulfate reductase
MVTKIGPKTKIFCLDTDLFFKETYETIDKVIERYAIQPLIYKPKISLEEQAKKYGEKLWERDPDLCCGLRKVEPLSRAFKELKLKAWITGMRREQAPTRRNIGKIEWDSRWNLVKINPLADWSSKEVWRYAIKNKLPYNPLHDRGYPSIGCEPCTKPAEAESDKRSGRWKGLAKKECGIHYKTTFDKTKSPLPQRLKRKV